MGGDAAVEVRRGSSLQIPNRRQSPSSRAFCLFVVPTGNQTTTRTLVSRRHVELLPAHAQLSSLRVSAKAIRELRSPPQKDKGILPQSQAEAFMSAGFFIWILYFF